MLQPKKVKHRKHHRGRMKGNSKGASELAFGEYGIQALEPGWITSRQIEAARIAMTRHIKRGGKVWINVFPDKSVTKKPAETRMGSGKGAPDQWVAVVKPGRVLFEVAGIEKKDAVEAFRLASMKLPVNTVTLERAAGLGEVVFGKKFLAKVASGVSLEETPVAADAAPKEPELVKPVKPAKEDEA